MGKIKQQDFQLIFQLKYFFDDDENEEGGWKLEIFPQEFYIQILIMEAMSSCCKKCWYISWFIQTKKKY